MTRCEEFSRGEYAPRLLAYFLFLKSLLHEITQENQLKIDPKDSKDKEVETLACFSSPWLLFAISFYPARRIFQSFVRKRVKDENYFTTGLQCKISRNPVFPTEGFAWRKEAHFPRHTRLCKWVHFFWKLTILSLHSSLLNPCNDSLFLISIYLEISYPSFVRLLITLYIAY